jgi:hypothetical protein
VPENVIRYFCWANACFSERRWWNLTYLISG